jgi:hypothetical protein
MPNYTLTTDLIADLMTLIPQNLELLNEGNSLFEFDYHGFDTDKLKIKLIIEDRWIDNPWESFIDYIKSRKHLHTLTQPRVVCHCLENIPEFQVENPKLDYVKECYEYNKALAENPQSQDRFILWHATGCYREEIDGMPKTIASATLHGQGEFPPNTLDGLCESYKNVMSK